MTKKLFLNGLFLLNLALLISFWWYGSSSLILSTQISDVLIGLGRLCGLLLELFILLQLILIGRMSWIETLYGHDKLNKYHRWVGYSLSVFIFAHPLLITYGYALQGKIGFWRQILTFINDWRYVFLAIIGFLLFISIILISMPIIRKKLKYEVWYSLHLLMYVAIGFVFLHQIQTADVSNGIRLYYWYTLNFIIWGMLLFYRFIKAFIVFFKYKFEVKKVIQETPSTYSIYIGGRDVHNFKFKPGHHANFIFLGRGFWFAHPFSFSTAEASEFIRITFKKVGDFTNRLPNIKIGTKVIIDGPLGLFVEDIATKDKFLFIAGGVGITPIRSLVESLAEKKKDIVLMYGNRNTNDVIFGEELVKLDSKIHFVFSEQQIKDLEFGTIDEEKIKRLVPDFADREIYVCGPPPMMDSLVKIFIDLGIPKSQIHLEKF